VAIVAQHAGPDEKWDVKSAARSRADKDGYLVAWGTEAEMAGAYIKYGDGGDELMPLIGSADVALTATYQERAFEDRCQQTINSGGHGTGNLEITARHGADHVLKVYRYDKWIGLCGWENEPDRPADGLTMNGPGTSLASSDITAMPQEFASEMFIQELDGIGSWMAGAIPPGTLAVDVTLKDGTVVPAQIGGDVYAVWLPGTGDHLKVVATTATEIWTAQGDKVTRVPR
jgi:hypothetical protein